MSQTAIELLSEIQKELNKLDEFFDEKQRLIAEIETIVKEVQQIAERESDWQLMNKGTRITQKITHVLNTSTDDTDELHQAISSIINENAAESGLDESNETLEALERILEKTRFSNALASTLRSTLADILEEAKALKKKDAT